VVRRMARLEGSQGPRGGGGFMVWMSDAILEDSRRLEKSKSMLRENVAGALLVLWPAQ
jgi:hypothetical protein